MEALRRWFVNDGFIEGDERIDVLRVVSVHSAAPGRIDGVPGRRCVDRCLCGRSAVLDSHVCDHGFLPPLFQPPRLRRIASGSVRICAARRECRTTRPAVVGRRASPPSRRSGYRGRSPFPRRGFLHAHLGWFLSRKHFATDLERVKDWAKFPSSSGSIATIPRFRSSPPPPCSARAPLYNIGCRRWEPPAFRCCCGAIACRRSRCCTQRCW